MPWVSAQSMAGLETQDNLSASMLSANRALQAARDSGRRRQLLSNPDPETRRQLAAVLETAAKVGQGDRAPVSPVPAPVTAGFLARLSLV